MAYRSRRLDDFTAADEPPIEKMFGDFERALGPVGSAKTLHLMAPEFFPLWDQAIARKAYGVSLGALGANGSPYITVMRAAQQQIAQVGGWLAFGAMNPVKALDEFNYCTYTLGVASAWAPVTTPPPSSHSCTGSSRNASGIFREKG